MGFSFSLGGNKGSSSNSSQGSKTGTQTQDQTTTNQGTTDTSVTQSQITDQSQTTNSQTSGSVLSEQLLSTLDVGTQETLRALIAGLGDTSQPASEIGQALGELALNTGADTTAIVDNARRKGELNLGQSQQKLARATGSSLNSSVQQFGLEEARSMETELASLQATLDLQNQSGQLTALSTAFQAEQGAQTSQVDQIAKLADVLKGATQSTSASQTSTQTSTQVMDALSQLTGITDTTQLQDLITQLSGSATTSEKFNQSGSGKESSVGFGLGFGK